MTTLKENIITKLGLDKLSDDEKIALLERMTDVIQKRIALRITKLLSGPLLDEYLKIVDNDEIEGNKFLVEKIPNYAEIIDEEIANFKQEMVA